MKKLSGYSLAITAVSAALLALPAQAVQVSFSGANLATANAVNGSDTLGNTWTTSNGPEEENSSYTMADSAETAQIFNRVNFSNGLGSFANSFQLTINKSQQGSGFTGILETPVASGLINGFRVQEIANDDASWYAWDLAYKLLDTDNNLFQRILFTAPTGKQLSQGQNFKMNVNFAGIMTTDSGWAASWDDRAAPTVVSDIPEPTSLALLGLGMMGLVAVKRRKKV